ncbi:hypothetical protein [Methylomonas rapida]|uniref:Uncharacterized protein n=1 Tax=Methylomonas rapida TaxID=2963939 RepID=A0ABY7GLV5_9GAMM|nr:hypothetical protein [Methylomonas rapida]WAR43609.1 hypothetical protein NM686_014640 [Methylomonas rapida]WAR45480.1 hypothetical protein NM686_002910 [Methylomonas rapida]
MDRIATQERIQELRLRAKHLRDAAQHADSRAAYNEDMRAAARAEDEADELVAQLQDAQS